MFGWGFTLLSALILVYVADAPAQFHDSPDDSRNGPNGLPLLASGRC